MLERFWSGHMLRADSLCGFVNGLGYTEDMGSNPIVHSEA